MTVLHPPGFVDDFERRPAFQPVGQGAESDRVGRARRHLTPTSVTVRIAWLRLMSCASTMSRYVRPRAGVKRGRIVIQPSRAVNASGVSFAIRRLPLNTW